jgi:secretion/DNA translocation related TadE-like protein
MTAAPMSARDRGSAAVWVLSGLAIVLVATSLAVAVGVVTVARHRAATAADAAALAAATHALDGRPAACGEATTLAHANGAQIVACELRGADAIVTVRVGLSGLLARLGSAVERARAGPLSEAPDYSP